MSATALADRIEGLVHADTQVGESGVDLTAAGIARVAEAGRIDFGGGELAPADLAPVGTAPRNPDDEYGWWNLDAGGYVVTVNERLTGEQPVRVEPRRELTARGGSMPSVTTTTLDPLPLVVPAAAGGGPALRVKENARIATVRPV
ncbi:MAG: dCTP deaminase [Haloferacaceae archaeon]